MESSRNKFFDQLPSTEEKNKMLVFSGQKTATSAEHSLENMAIRKKYNWLLRESTQLPGVISATYRRDDGLYDTMRFYYGQEGWKKVEAAPNEDFDKLKARLAKEVKEEGKEKIAELFEFIKKATNELKNEFGKIVLKNGLAIDTLLLPDAKEATQNKFFTGYTFDALNEKPQKGPQ